MNPRLEKAGAFLKYLFTLKSDEMIMLDYDEMNADYFLLTSELPAYNSRDNYYIFVNSGYGAYMYNTIGYLEQEVSRRSGDELNTIITTCIDGRPRYFFVDKYDDLHAKVLPYSPLYKPIVLNPEEFDEVPETQMLVLAQCRYSSNSLGVNPNDLSIIEREQGFSAKILLADHAFYYPITSISLQLVTSSFETR